MHALARRLGRAASLLCALGMLATLPVRAAPLTEVIQQVKPSIVGVGTYMETRRPPAQFLGTGFVVGNGRYVVTNAHVLPERLDVENREALGIFSTVGDTSRLVSAKLVAKDDVFDVAILEFSGPALPALTLGDDSKVAEGRPIAFTGFPIGPVLGLYPVTHVGIISALTPNARPVLDPSQLSPDLVQSLKRKDIIFQLDATAYPGNSGSPVYDQSTGHVIAVLSSVYIKSTKENLLSEPSGISYAIPIRHVRELLATLPQ
jgi:S1-C subfamily serine protease